MPDAAKQLHADVLRVIESMMPSDPAADSSDGKILSALAEAVEKYETSPSHAREKVTLVAAAYGHPYSTVEASVPSHARPKSDEKDVLDDARDTIEAMRELWKGLHPDDEMPSYIEATLHRLDLAMETTPSTIAHITTDELRAELQRRILAEPPKEIVNPPKGWTP